MNDVLRDMLTLAQGETLSGITKVNADVSKIADGICLQFDAVAFEKNITLESRIQENVFADCDEKMIRRLFTILIDNAVKYEPEGGIVFVALQKNGNKTTFAVRNFGSTVKKEDLPPFIRAFLPRGQIPFRRRRGIGACHSKKHRRSSRRHDQSRFFRNNGNTVYRRILKFINRFFILRFRHCAFPPFVLRSLFRRLPFLAATTEITEKYKKRKYVVQHFSACAARQKVV